MANKVLVVDDEAGVRWALEMVLLRNGFSVASVGSGEEALAWLGQQKCQVILMDAKLGDIEGVELARKIRKQGVSVAPVILVSGYFYRDDSTVQSSLMAGDIAGFVTKPFRHEEILKAIHCVLMTGASTLPMAPAP